MAESKISLKLMIDSQGKRVVFAEAGKDFVDFLFHIISLPVSTVIALLRKRECVGSFATLYKSIETMNEFYIQPNQTKDAILKPVSPSSFPLLTFNGAPAAKKTLYGCNNCLCVSNDPGVACPDCTSKMETPVSYVDAHAPGKHGEGGFVKGVVTYMVMDDLEVKPMSIISSIALLNKFNIEDISLLEERIVNFGINEAFKLLSASWQSEKVLTDVFLESTAAIKREGMDLDCTSYQFI